MLYYFENPGESHILLHMGAGIFRLRKNSEKVLNTLRADGISWSIKPVPSRIVAIGDVHGDIVGLSCILLDRELINRKGHWSGNGTHLILNGDLVGGKNARLLLQFVMRLETEAAASGGAVHSLLGNHDIQVFSKRYKNHAGKTLFQKYEVTGALKRTMRDAFCGNTSFSRWIRARNAIIKIGPTIFAHGGLNAWAFRHHPERINATIRAWIRFWQGIDRQPDPRTEWVALGPWVDWSPPSTGPLWTRSFKVVDGQRKNGKAKNAPDLETFGKLLSKYRARRVVIGHTPVDDNKIVLSHPYYGRAVVMIDSRISSKKGGRLSCIEICGDEVKAHYAKRTRTSEKIAEIERKRLKKRMS